MQHYKFTVALMGLLLCVSCAHVPTSPSVTWRAVDVRPHQMWHVVDGFDYDCWRVDFEVSNSTGKEMIVDWNRDESAFLVHGRWQNLGISALMPYLEPHSSGTFSLYAPHEAEACRFIMYYKLGSAARSYRQLVLESELHDLPPKRPFENSMRGRASVPASPDFWPLSRYWGSRGRSPSQPGLFQTGSNPHTPMKRATVRRVRAHGLQANGPVPVGRVPPRGVRC
jgi:hypothetical protein